MYNPFSIIPTANMWSGVTVVYVQKIEWVKKKTSSIVFSPVPLETDLLKVKNNKNIFQIKEYLFFKTFSK